jgi:hypothetical protein
MTDSAIMGEPFRIGACLSKSISAFFKNFISFNILGLVIMVPGVVIIALLFGGTFLSLLTYDPALGGPPPDIGSGFAAGFISVFFIFFALQYLLTGAIVYSSVQYLNGARPSLVAALGQMFRRIVPVILVAIVSAILVWIGLILLIVPGIIIAMMLCMAIPVVMVEGPGVFASLSRSRALTKGYRWHIFGTFLVALIATTIVTMLLGVVIGIVTIFMGELGATIGTFANLALQLFTTVFLAVVLAVAYHDLRVAKEGVSTAQLAAVFD